MSNDQWHYAQNGVPQTPVSEAELRQRAADGGLKSSDMVWRQGMPQWMPAGNIPGLFAPGAAPPPMPINYYTHAPSASDSLGQNAGIRMLLPVGRSGWAIAAGYFGLFSFVIFPAPIALILSIIAIWDIKKHPDRHGLGRAIFGLIMGIGGTVLLVFFLLARVLR